MVPVFWVRGRQPDPLLVVGPCMAEITHIGVQPLDYGASPPPRNADPRRMFMYLLPAAICIGAIIGSLMIEYTFPNRDSHQRLGWTGLRIAHSGEVRAGRRGAAD